MYKIGYIDEDKGWSNTFYQYFKEEFDIVLIDISSETTIESIISDIKKNELDAVIIDFRLDESGMVNFNGDAIAESLMKINPHFPIMMLTSYEQDAIDHVEDVNIINAKDILDGEKPEKVDVLKAKIHSNINNYYTKIRKSENRIEELNEKKNDGTIEPAEEEELVKLYMYIDEVYPDDKRIPANLIQPGAITKLDEFVSQTKEILKQLKKKKD